MALGVDILLGKQRQVDPQGDMSRLYCALIVGWVSASFDNIDDERRLFDGFVK